MFWKRSKRKGESEYTCSECGEIHSDWPALTFIAPTNYNVLPESVQDEIAELSSDFCQIRHEEQTDRFIRVTLIQQVNDSEEDLHYGLWVSLSEKSYNDYDSNYDNENHETTYFGWVSNMIPEYDDTLGIPMNVYTQKGNQRPIVAPHESHDHPFVYDYYHGISPHEAQTRVDSMASNSN